MHKTVRQQHGVASWVMLVMALVVMVSGYVGWRAFDRTPSDEPVADSGPFELVDAAQRDWDGSPALALSFSLPLDARSDPGAHIQVLEMPRRPQDPGLADENPDENEPEASQAVASQISREAVDLQTEGGKPVAGAWTVGDNPRLLFFPHVKPQTRYLVRVNAGITARSGARLAQEDRLSIRTASVSPAFYFASKGMVLPAGQNGGLPVMTVNVPEVDIQFLKVKPEHLPAFLDRVIASAPKARTQAAPEGEDGEGDEGYNPWDQTRMQGAVNSWTLDQFHKLTTSAFVGRFQTEAKPNRRAVTFIPVEQVAALREPGVYIAVMSQPNRFRHEYQTTYFYVSDLGLQLRQYTRGGAEAWVSSLVDGKAVAGVQVSWLGDKGQTLASADTDTQGRASLSTRPKAAKVVVARKGEQLSLIALREPALDLAEFDIGGFNPGPVRLFAYSGRNLYRPGETFDVSVLARDADGRPVPAQPVQAVLRRPDGKAQWTAAWQPQERFGGYYRQRIELPPDAATGFWNLELRSDPAAKLAASVMRIGVEEFLPERMKLDLNTDRPHLGQEGSWSIDVKGRYLYGAPAAGNKLVSVVNTERQRNPLDKQLPGFVFGDADEDSVRSRTELGEQALDDEGQGQVAVDLAPLRERRSPFVVRTTVSLLESGGRPVVRSLERNWWPAPVLVGVRPMFTGAYAREGSNAEFEMVRADMQGQMRPAQGLPVRLFRENRYYYWRFDDQRGWHSGYNETDELVASTQLNLGQGGRAKLALPVKYGRYRLEVLDPETRLTTRYRFYAGWSAKDDETQGVRPDRVALKLDKPAYSDGETVRLSLTPPHGGEALITVEGDQLLWSKRLSVGPEATTVDIPLDAAWARHDLYISAVVLRPGNATDRGSAGVTPARALGLVHLPLQRDHRNYAVTLEAPKKMAPDQPLKVKVKVPQAKGQSAAVTLSAVDAGILNITQFKSPDPHGFFFGKVRYGQDLYDLYGRVIEKMDGQKGKLKWGGDGAPKPTRSLPKKVKLVDLFSGPVALNADGEAQISLPVPDFNGSLRLMAVVASGERFGMQEAEVTVAAPLVVELATPRFLNAGDTALLALDVHNLSGSAQTVKLQVSSPDGLVIRQAEQTVQLADHAKRVLRVGVEAGQALGLTEAVVRIQSPAMTLERRFAIQVQVPTPRQNLVRRAVLAPGDTLDLRETDLGGLLPFTVSGTLAVSDRPPIDVRSAVQGLLTYPYGCTEQTTSTAYPHVFIDEQAAQQFGLKAYSQAQRAEMLDKAIARLAGMQAPNGGFSLWGNAGEYQYWLSAYVSLFLLDAREQGFNVPAELEKKAVDYLLKGLQEGAATLPRGPLKPSADSIWNDVRYAGSGRFGVLAYGAYVLARHHKAPLSTLRQLHESLEQAHSGLGLVHLGLALKLMGDEPRAQATLNAALARPRNTQLYWWGDYGSPLRDWAQMSVLLQRHEVVLEGRDNLLTQVAGELERQRYLSTQEKLAVFLMGRQYATQQRGAWAAEVTRAGKPAALAGQGTQFLPVTSETLASGLKLRNTHTEKLFVELAYAGHGPRMPEVRNDVFDIQRQWFTPDGQPLGNRPLKVGETLVVGLQVKTRGRYAQGLIVDPVPAGVEIENANLAQGEGGTLTLMGVDVRDAMTDNRIKHREFRDDRFVVAAKLEGNFHMFYRVRVVTPGRFVHPPTYVEDMYQPQVNGLGAGAGTVVVSEGS